MNNSILPFQVPFLDTVALETKFPTHELFRGHIQILAGGKEAKVRGRKLGVSSCFMQSYEIYTYFFKQAVSVLGPLNIELSLNPSSFTGFRS